MIDTTSFMLGNLHVCILFMYACACTCLRLYVCIHICGFLYTCIYLGIVFQNVHV